MVSPSRVLVLVVLSLVATQAKAQTSDYDWARALSLEFGYDDMAEKILNDLVNGAKKSQIEKLQGKLGLAEMKGRQGRRAATLAERLTLMDQARQLVQSVKDEWPEKGSADYLKALFAFVQACQDRGTMAMTAVTEGKVDGKPLAEDEAEKLRQQANADFGRAEGELEKVRATVGEVDPAQNREKWRLRNRASYTLCELRYNKAQTMKKGSSQAAHVLVSLKDDLEQFIVSNETDDEEAMLGALYGYLLKGQVHAILSEWDEATGSISSVLDQIVFEQKLAPPIQQLVEEAYRLLFVQFNEQKKFDQTVRYGDAMEGHFKKLGMSYGLRGRAARVAYAEAKLRLGDMNAALGITANVAEDASDDASGRLANLLIAEIIAATPDKTQFAPEIIRSAAKGAMSQGPAKYAQAMSYYQILLETLPRVTDEEERAALGAEAWLNIGIANYERERFLEAGLAFGEGARKYGTVTKDGLGERLVRSWDRSLATAAQLSGSPEIKALHKACVDEQIRSGSGSKSKGELLFAKAREAEQIAVANDKDGKSDVAVAKFEEAATIYKEVSLMDGPKKEQALIKAARMGLKVAKVHLKKGEKDKGGQGMAQAKDQFLKFLTYSSDAANKLTDPELSRARENAQAEARYNIADCNEDLIPAAKSEEDKKALHLESIAQLKGFEKDYPGQSELRVFAVNMRIKSRIATGDIASAEADYEVLRGLDPKHELTALSALLVGKALRKPAEDALLAVTAKATPADPEWAQVQAKPEFPAARQGWMKVCAYYRAWVEAARAPKFSDYNTVALMHFQVGAWTEVGELTRTAVEKFANTAEVKADDMVRLQYRGLIAWVNLAKEADAAGQGDVASRLWADAGRAAEVVLKDPKLGGSRSAVRLAATVYGGYITRREGLTKYYNALGRFDKSAELWEKLERATRAAETQADFEMWWESKFYNYYGIYRQRIEQKADMKDLRSAYVLLKATKPELGGPTWKPFFEWLERELGVR